MTRRDRCRARDLETNAMSGYPRRSGLRARRTSRGRAVPRIEAVEARLLLATLMVTSANDSGAGSLRQAIIDANANPNPDDIVFNIGGGGPARIALQSALDDVRFPTNILATTQPGFN